MFKNRFDAAYTLVPLLKKYQSDPNAVVLAIPRGGLELGYILAQELKLPLDVIFTKKIGSPLNPEYAIGAVSELSIFLNDEFKNLPDFQQYAAQEAAKIREVIKERNLKYRHNMPPFNVHDKTVIVVDDGVATGNTLLATLALLKGYQPKKIVVALPIASYSALKKIEKNADEVVVFAVPEVFYSVSQFYEEFEQVDDQEAIHLLHKANE